MRESGDPLAFKGIGTRSVRAQSFTVRRDAESSLGRSSAAGPSPNRGQCSIKIRTLHLLRSIKKSFVFVARALIVTSRSFIIGRNRNSLLSHVEHLIIMLLSCCCGALNAAVSVQIAQYVIPGHWI